MSRHFNHNPKDKSPLVVVAGAAGFIGSHLVESLLHSGAKVIGLDNITTGSLDRLASVEKHRNFEFIEVDLNQSIPTVLRKKPITHVVHTLGQDAHTPDQLATLSSLVSGSFATKNLLDLAVSTGAIFTMTSSIYLYQGLYSSSSLQNYFGSDSQQRATYSLLEAKRYAESLVEMYVRQYNLDARIARLSTVYGPRMDIFDQTSVDKLFHQAIRRQDLVIEEDGSRELYLTYISDVIYGLSKLIFSQGDQFSQTIYSLVNPDKISLLSLAYTLRSLIPGDKEVRFLASHSTDYPQPPVINIDKARTDLQWEPITNLSQGVEATLKSFQDHPPITTSHPQLQPKQLNILPPSPSTSQITQETALAETSSKPSSESLPAQTAPSTLESQKDHESDSPTSPSPPSVLPGPTPNLKYRTLNSQQLLDLHRQKESPASDPVSLKSTKPKIFLAILAVILLTLYFLIAQPLLHTAISTTHALVQARQGLNNLNSAQFNEAHDSFSQSRASLAIAVNKWQRLESTSHLLHFDVFHQQVHQLLASSTNLTDSLSIVSQTAQLWPQQINLLSQSLSGRVQEPSQTTKQEVTSLINQTRTSLSQAQDQLSQSLHILNSNPLNQRVASATTSTDTQENISSDLHSQQGIVAQVKQKMRQQIIQGQLSLTQLEQFIEVAPDLLGLERPQRYLVMLQNSNELRATGGFTGSLIEMEIDRGVVVNFKVDDIYNPDGQIKESLNPGTSLPKKAAQKAIPLRDANWYPDVPTSAKNTINLYQKATGRSIDGLVYLTPHSVKPVLEHLGPLYLEEFQKQVTSDNFSQLAQMYSNVNYQAGSSQKKDFLGVLFHQLINQTSSNSQLLPKIAQAIHSGLQTQEIQLYSTHPSLTALINQHDWSGTIKPADGDYFRVIDSNIGANKVNHQVTRSTSYQISVDRQGYLTALATIKWQHHGQSATWPGGDYRNYLRLYTPQGSRLLKTNGLKINQVDQFTERDKQVFASQVTVPVGQSLQVQFEYRLPKKLGLVEKNHHYTLLWQKQSGLPQEPLSVKFNTPAYLTSDKNPTSWNLNADSDHLFTTTFTPVTAKVK